MYKVNINHFGLENFASKLAVALDCGMFPTASRVDLVDFDRPAVNRGCSSVVERSLCM